MNIIKLPAEQKIEELAEKMKYYFGKIDIRFPEGLSIVKNGKKICELKDVATDNQSRIWVMNSQGSWTQILPGQIWAEYILDTVIGKLMET